MEDMDSPTKARALLELVKRKTKFLKKSHDVVRRKKKRLERKISSLNEILKVMKKKALISNSTSDVLEVKFFRSF